MGEDLTKRLAANPDDEKLWEEWYRLVYPRVYYILYRKTRGNAELSAECTQQSIERAFRYRVLSKLWGDREAVAYITAAALRVLLNITQRNRREVALNDDIETVESPDEALEVRTVRRRLAVEERVLLDLIMAGYLTKEIAILLSISYSAAAVRMHRLKKKLKKISDKV